MLTQLCYDHFAYPTRRSTSSLVRRRGGYPRRRRDISVDAYCAYSSSFEVCTALQISNLPLPSDYSTAFTFLQVLFKKNMRFRKKVRFSPGFFARCVVCFLLSAWLCCALKLCCGAMHGFAGAVRGMLLAVRLVLCGAKGRAVLAALLQKAYCLGYGDLLCARACVRCFSCLLFGRDCLCGLL